MQRSKVEAPAPDRQTASAWGPLLGAGWRPVGNVLPPDLTALLGRVRLSPQRLPGRMPQALSRAKLPALRAKEWYCAEKTDGYRGVLAVTPGHVYLQCRKSHWFVADAAVPSGHNTVLDGEYLESPPGVRRYLAFDALLARGCDVRACTYTQRLHEVALAVEALRVPCADAVGALSAKVVQRARQPWLTELATKRILRDHTGTRACRYRFGDLDHATDGVVFTRDLAGYHDAAPLKFKWDHTIDCVVERPASLHEPIPLLVRLERNAEHRFAELDLSGDAQARARLRAQLDASAGHRCVVEVRYDAQQGRWVLHGFRPDKEKGNFITVAVDALALTAERLTLREVRDVLKP